MKINQLYIPAQASYTNILHNTKGFQNQGLSWDKPENGFFSKMLKVPPNLPPSYYPERIKTAENYPVKRVK